MVRALLRGCGEVAVGDEFAAVIEQVARQAFNASLQCLQAKLRARAPVDSGETRSTLTVTALGFDGAALTGIMVAPTPQADFTNRPRGTGGGDFILPRPDNPRQLLFFTGSDGSLVAARRVRVSRKHEGWIDKNIENDWRECLERAFG